MKNRDSGYGTWPEGLNASRRGPIGRIQKVATICFSPDGRYFAAVQPCYALSAFDARTGEEFNVSPRICIGEFLQFSPDGRFLLFMDRSVNHPDDLIFWDFRAGREFCRIEATTRQVNFAADGRSFATAHWENVEGRDRFTRVLLWTLDSAGRPALERTHAIQAASVVFSPDLSMYAIVDPDRRGFSLWDMADGTRWLADRFEESDRGDAYLHFLQDGRTLAAENDEGKIIVWNTTPKPKRIGSLIAPQSWDVGFPEPSPDGKYLAVPLADEHMNVSVWPRSLDVGAALVNLTTLEEDARLVVKSDRVPFNIHCCPYPSAQFSPDGKLLAVDAMEEPGRQPLYYNILPPAYNPFPWIKQGPIARVWDVAARTQMAEFPRCFVQFSPDGKVGSGSRLRCKSAPGPMAGSVRFQFGTPAFCNSSATDQT